MPSAKVLLGGCAAIVLIAGGSYLVLSQAERQETITETVRDPVGTTQVVNTPTTTTEPAEARAQATPTVPDSRDGNTTQEPKDNTTVTTPAPEAPPTAPEPVKTSPSYTLSEVSIHNSRESCWTIVNGKVYNLTSYIDRHPGGPNKIMQICGRDGTSLFEGQHGGDPKPESRLETLYLGELSD